MKNKTNSLNIASSVIHPSPQGSIPIALKGNICKTDLFLQKFNIAGMVLETWDFKRSVSRNISIFFIFGNLLKLS
jgi:hypothetical protein